MNTFIKYIVLFNFMLCFVATSQAQFRKNCTRVDVRKAEPYYNKALMQLKFNQREALNLLQQAVDSVPDYYQAHFEAGKIKFIKLKELYEIAGNETVEAKIERLKPEVLYHFNKVLSVCEAYQNYASYFYMGEYHYLLSDYEKTESYLKEYKSHKTRDADKERIANSYLKKAKAYFELLNNPVPFSPLPVEGVCSEDDEFLPLLSPDGNYMFYTFRSRKDIRYTYSSRPIDRFVYSIRRNKSNSVRDTFSNKILMPEPFNAGRIQGAASITIDNKQIYITICEYERVGSTSYKNCDIYHSRFENDNWSTLRRMSNNINGNNTFEGQPSISADGNVLFFASARENGYGKMDIYKSTKDENGNWGIAVNLGPIINTPGNERTPFIHSDSRTLYYASDTHFGLGGYDIFHSKYDNGNKIDSFYTKYSDGFWSHPKNLGYPINTENDEFGCIVSADGEQLYLSSNAIGGRGGLDIFQSDLYEDARPIKVLFLKGRVHDGRGLAVTDVDIELQSIKTSQTTKGVFDNTNGEYVVAVPVRDKEDFIITAKKENHIYSSHYVNTNTDEFETPTIINMEMQAIKKGEVFVIHDIKFATSSWELNESSKAIIRQFVVFLNDNPELSIQLNGHTDNVGDADQNIILSQNRAKVVSNYLQKNGIKSSRLSYKGFGETRPIAPNTTDEGRHTNRRTEFIILRK